jgi:hypothetical protein
MDQAQTEIVDHKLSFFRRYLEDLGDYGALDGEGRRGEHCAIERVIAAIEPALALYRTFDAWLAEQMRPRGS